MIYVTPRSTLTAALVVALAGCASMQSQVTDFSGDYSVAMEQFENREIITNVLRARDRMPLHFSELSQINGSLQEQIQLGASVNFGPGATKNANQASPQLTFSSSPSFTTSPLDTQAFAVGMLQPIDVSYFASYWAQRRLPKELLFRLFVDSVRNADGAALPGPAGVLSNNPDARSAQDAESYKKFQGYMNALLAHDADFQSMTVMTPLGEPFQFDTNVPVVPALGSAYKMTDILGIVDETNIHLGRANSGYQLFRRWDDQLVLCYHKDILANASPAPAADIKPFVTTIENQIKIDSVDVNSRFTKGGFTGSFYAMAKVGKGPQGGGGGGGQQPQGASPRAGGPAGGAVQIASPVLPLAAMLPSAQCAQLEYVADPQGEERKIAEGSAKDVQFRLKSVEDVIKYLGSMLRKDPKNGFTSGDITFFQLTATDKRAAAEAHSRIYVDYVDGDTYHVGTGDQDYTSEVLGILTELVNARKLSSDIATTKQVQVIP